MADERPFIRVHDGMPDHPKVDGLSDKAFRLMVESWCWCNRQRTDGRIPAARWRKQMTPKARRELVAAGLAEELASGDIQMHDYLDWQRSAAEMADLKAAKSIGGSFGNHKRWHVDRNIKDPDCVHCDELRSDNPSDSDRNTDGPDESQNGNGEHDKRSVTRKTSSQTSEANQPVENPEIAGQPEDAASHYRSQTDRTPIGQRSHQNQNQGPTVPSGGSVDHHLRPQTREASTDDDQSRTIDELIAAILADETGRKIEPERASEIRRELLAARPGVRSPMAYVAKAVRANPQRFAPPRAPSDRSVAEAIAEATRGDS